MSSFIRTFGYSELRLQGWFLNPCCIAMENLILNIALGLWTDGQDLKTVVSNFFGEFEASRLVSFLSSLLSMLFVL